MTLPEITAPVDLCLLSGALNPAALGWTRTPLHRANLRTGNALGRAATWSRTRRWEYWCLMTPAHVVALTAASLNYAGLHQAWVLDRSTGQETDCAVTVPLARDIQMPSTCGGGPVRAQGGSLAIAIDHADQGARLRAVSPRLRLDATVAHPPGHESLGVVVPWSDRLFQYTLKEVALPASGRLWLDGQEFAFGDGEPAWAVLAFGRGRWPYSVVWNWAAGSGVVDGTVTGLLLGGKWTDGTGATENALVLDGRVHRIDEDLSWAYDSTNFRRAWFITGERVEVRFEPFHERTATLNLGVVRNRTNQCFGTWYGWMSDDTGVRHRIDGLEGWAEEVSNRW